MMDSLAMDLPGRMHRRLTVLIMDDAAAVRSLLADMLLEMDSIEEVVQAEDALSALRLVEEREPDIVILDINVRGAGIIRNGIDVLREVKKTHPGVEAMMLSNHSTEPYRSECQQAGADYFYDKGSEFEQLLDRIASYGRGR